MADHSIIFSTEMVVKILTCANCGTIEIKCPKCGSKDRLKTQTRRIIKPQPYKSDRNPPNYSDTAVGDLFICPDYFPTEEKGGCVIVECEALGTYHCMGVKAFVDKHCPYGVVGDTLWVREAWSFIGTGWSSQEPNQETIYVGYKADNSRRDIVLPYDPEKGELCNGLKTPGQINPYGETTDREAYLDWQQKWWEKQKNKSARFMFRWAARIFLEITNIRVERLWDISEKDANAEGIPEAYGILKPKAGFKRLWDSINAKRGYGWDSNPFVWCIEFKRVT